MNKRKVATIALGTIMLVSGFTGCKKEEVADDEKTLYIYAVEAGFGADWIIKTAEAFGELHPEYTVVCETERGNDRGDTLMRSGPSVNTYDLLITGLSFEQMVMQGDKVVSGYDCALENLTDLYDTVIPGENVTLREKTNPHILRQIAIEEETENGTWEDQYYMFSCANSLLGLVYNITLFEELGVDVPRTTEELYDACDEIKKTTTPYIGTFNASYMTVILEQFWAQYEGQAAYEKYWAPTSLNDYELMSQKGKLYAAQIVDQLYKSSYGRLHKDVVDGNFTEVQAKFITREAAILATGDWFENEMQSIIEQTADFGISDEYAMMKTPLNSAIVEKLSFWDKSKDYSVIFEQARNDSNPNAAQLQILKDADAKLLQIVDYVDGKTTEKPSFATDNDIAIVRESRNIVFTYALGTKAVIPTYATAKEAAKEFLLYLASDKAQKIVAENRAGTTMPYTYDAEADGVKMTSFARSARDIINDAIICKYSDYSRGQWQLGLYTYKLSPKNFALPTEYVAPRKVYESGIISYEEFQIALSTAGII